MYSSRSAEDAGEKTTSSRAVLAALRALQDKIARLEGERAEAVNSTKEMRHQLREMELKVESHRLDGAEESRLRSAYERLASEAASKDAAMLAAENRARAAERRLLEREARARETTLRARRVEEELDEAQRNGATPHVTPEERARYEDELAESASRRSAAEKKCAKLEAKLRTSERILETLIAMNKLLVNEKEADVDLDGVAREARAARLSPDRDREPRRRSPAPARRAAPKKATSALRAVRSAVDRAAAAAAAAPPRRAAPKKRVVKRRPPPPRDDVEAKPLPWVPSSDGGVSFNLAAACNYALRKTQQPAP